MSEEAPTFAPTELNGISNDDDEKEKIVTSWSSVIVTLIISVAQGLILYAFFLRQRKKEHAKGPPTSFNLYQPRQHTLSHRSPPPYTPANPTSWWRAAYQLSDKETLRCVGLDAFMFLRFLRIGARLALVGSLLACVLLPVYATGEAQGKDTQQFNQLTLARVQADSDRLWASLVAWYIFVFICLREFWQEWKLYTQHRYEFMARGDPDIPFEYRYAIRVEEVPVDMRSNEKLTAFFRKLFPGKIRQVIGYLNVDELQTLVDKRLKDCIAYEKAVAFTKAYPQKPPPQVTVTKGAFALVGNKRDAMDYYLQQVNQTNTEIDTYRRRRKLDVPSLPIIQAKTDEAITAHDETQENVEVTIPKGASQEDPEILSPSAPSSPSSSATLATDVSATAVVIFTSLRAKQAALQCQLRENIDSMVAVAAPDPRGVIWNNVTVPLHRQKVLSLQTTLFWVVGILFWAIPIGFVASISNLASILETVGVDDVDTDTAWYGLVSGLLPVIALAIFMAILYMAIVAVATHALKFKSRAEVDAYALFWHQLFQFANLWLLIIGGSLFNQLDAILNDLSGLAETIAAAMPGASVLFVNMINVGSFGAFGLELSMLPTYGVTMILNLLSPEASRTQRMLDDAKKTPMIEWGQQIPSMVFVFLVTIIYMPIVPIIEIFALVYFSGHYLVWKHQFLHVYAQEHEGGGEATWGRLFGFLMTCLYTGEVVFIAYMGIKEAPTQSTLGFVPLALTVVMHLYLQRNVMAPLQNLSLEAAAHVDVDDGELDIVDTPAEEGVSSLYAQPCLKDDAEDRQPLPYRREEAVAEGALGP